MGSCLHKDNAALFRACHCVVEQAPLLVAAAADCRRPKNDDVLEFSVLSTVNCHRLPAPNIASSRLAALGKRLLDQLHDLIPCELYLCPGSTLNLKPFGHISNRSGITSSGEDGGDGNSVSLVGQLDRGKVFGCSFCFRLLPSDVVRASATLPCICASQTHSLRRLSDGIL
jgi:hypothetical protein